METTCLTRNHKGAFAYVRKNWDAPVPTTDCPYCNGTGRADESNECGFCDSDL